MTNVISTIRLRRNVAASWTAGNPVLLLGEPAYESDTGKLKIGNGTSNWVTLPYFGAATAADLTDVTITGPIADNEVLAYDLSTTQWTNQTPAEAGLSVVGHTHTLNNVTVTDIPTAADLNTYLTQGLYHQSLNAQAAAGTNYPVAYAGLLEVFVSGSMTYQRYTVYQAFAATYYRSRYVTTWGAWERLAESTDTTYVGTTSIALDRASASQTLTGVSIDGNAASATKTEATVTGTNSAELVRGNMGDNDQFRILVGATATNAGYAEIATADDATEPIYVRQYTGTFTTLTRTATLLDGSGNTSFPGSVTANSLNLTTALAPEDGGVPTGSIIQYAGTTAPTGYVLSQGQELAIATYGALYSVLGTTYGALTNGAGAAGTTHFRVPDLRGRVPMGAGTGTGNSTDGSLSGTGLVTGGTALTARTLGAWGGAQTHTLAATQIPSHTHSGTTGNQSADHTHTFSGTTSTNGLHSHNTHADWGTAGGGNTNTGGAADPRGNPTDDQGSHNHTYSGTTSGVSANHTHSFTTDNGTGGGGAHNNIQPFMVLNYIIKT